MSSKLDNFLKGIRAKQVDEPVADYADMPTPDFATEQEYVNPAEVAEVMNVIAKSERNSPKWTDRATPSAPTMPKSANLSDHCKIEPDSRLGSALLISFEELVRVTQEGNKYGGAILVVLLTADNREVDQWLPKKLCSNLDLTHNTVCVWDTFMNERIKELGGLSYDPAYASTS